MYYKTEIISIINVIRDIDVEIVGSRLLRLVGSDAIGMIQLLRNTKPTEVSPSLI